MGDNKLTVKELITYLQMFTENEQIHILLPNIEERKVYECKNLFLLTDMGIPVMGIVIGGARDMDEDEKAACDAEEREGKWRG